MPTTTSTATITRLELVRRAFRRIGMDNPSNDQIISAVSLLNDMVKEIDTEGRWLWAISNTPQILILIPGQRWYEAGVGPSLIASDIMFLEWVEIVQGTSLRPLRIITEKESLSNIQRESTGQPYFVFLEQNAVNAKRRLGFFPTPNNADTVNYTYRRRLYDFLNPADNPDFPQDWAIALGKRLSYELSPEYGIPLEERLTLKSEAEEAMLKRLKANAEQATARPERSQYY